MPTYNEREIDAFKDPKQILNEKIKYLKVLSGTFFDST